MQYISKKYVLLLGMTIGNAVYADNLSTKNIANCYQGANNELKYLEFVFIEQPKAELAQIAQNLQAGIFAVIASLTIANNYWTKPQEINWINATAYGTLTKIVYEYLINNIQQSIQQKALANFMQNWDVNKTHIPEELVPAFEEIAQTYTQSPEQASQLIDIIHHLIEHEFSKRYEKEKTKNIDPSDALKSIFIDISKNPKK